MHYIEKTNEEHKKNCLISLGFRKPMSQVGVSNDGAVDSRDWV